MVVIEQALGGTRQSILSHIYRSWVRGFVALIVPGFIRLFILILFSLSFINRPIGQVFYKKLIATKLFGRVLTGPEYFGTYLVTVLMSAWLLQQTFLQSKNVGNWSKKTVDQLACWM
jgi:hypothetical protein